MGIVFLVVTVGRVLRRKAGHVLAARDYPQIANEFGLVFKPSSYKSGAGTLSGDVDGFRVLVDPDDQRAIRVRFPDESLGIELHTYEHNQRPRKGQRAFRVTGTGVSGWFKTSFATPELIEAVHDERVLAEFRALRTIRELSSLSLTPSGFRAVFDYGSPPFIPASIVREVVKGLIDVARRLHEAVASEPHEEPAPGDPDELEEPTESGELDASSQKHE